MSTSKWINPETDEQQVPNDMPTGFTRRAFICGGTVVVAAVLTGMVGCQESPDTGGTGSNSSGSSSAQKVLRVASGASRINSGLDVADYATYNYFSLASIGVGECLFHLDDTLTPQYGLASDLKQTDDLNWEITLREDVTCHNGNNMTAQVVQRCLERTLRDFSLATESLTLTKLEATGDYTLTLATSTPTPGLKSILSDTMFMIYDFEDGADFNTGSYYTGPFVVDSIEPDIVKKLVRFEQYWGEPALLDEVDYINSESMTAALQSGDVDIAQSVPITDLALFTNSSEFTVSATLVPRGEQFWFNDNKAVASDPAIREAVGLCLDRQAIAENIYQEMAVPSYGIYPDFLSFGGTGGLRLLVDTYDPTKAASVLAAAGWADTDGDGILEKDGNKAELQCVSFADPSLLAVGDLLASEMAKIGVQVSVISTPDTRTYEEADDFDMILITYGMCMIGNPYYWNNTMVASTASSNTGHYNNPEVDILIEELNAEPDTGKRDQICKQIQQHMIDDQHWIVFAHKKLWTVFNNKVSGFVQSPCQYYFVTNEIDITA